MVEAIRYIKKPPGIQSRGLVAQLNSEYDYFFSMLRSLPIPIITTGTPRPRIVDGSGVTKGVRTGAALAAKELSTRTEQTRSIFSAYFFISFSFQL